MKKIYIQPEIEIVSVSGNALMEVWSIGIDNDPGHAIDPGEEGDIGAKEGFLFDEDEEAGSGNRTLWDY